MTLSIVETGWATTIQDRGRVGAAALGVPRAGPADPAAHRRANRIVGNSDDAAALETGGGLVVDAGSPVVLATSADGQRHTMTPGGRIRVSPAPGEQWAYLAVRGGLATEVVMGSRSHDTLSGLGPPPLRPGDELAIGPDPGGDMPTDLAPARRTDAAIGVWPGPRHAPDPLIAVRWEVKDEVSRVGVRLAAVSEVQAPTPELPSRGHSEGLVLGAIQWTPAGEPIVMLADHPTTGGYPVIGVVDPADIGRIAQSPPGTRLRFRPVRR